MHTGIKHEVPDVARDTEKETASEAQNCLCPLHRKSQLLHL